MTRLRQLLNQRDHKLFKHVEALVERATPQLWHTWSTFTSGTKHTPEHTQVVEEIASLLLSDEMVALLKDDEIAMVILASHFHDLGMAGTESDNATESSRDQVRREHAIAIGERIRHRWKELGFENLNYAETLAEICRGHRPEKSDGVANWNALEEYRNIGPSRFVRLRVVSAIVYAADELHLGDDRAPKREEDWKEIHDPSALRHWRRHQAISGPTNPTTEISFDARTDTFSFEADIRMALKKALLAVADLNREMSVIGVTNNLPRIRVQWLRERLWMLLLAAVCNDGKYRSKDEIASEILLRFKRDSSAFETLEGLCVESPVGDDKLLHQIARAVSDFVIRELLIPGTDPETFCLSAAFRAAQAILTLTAAADSTERLFARSIDAVHERRFYESEVGKQFIRKSVFADIKTGYSVDMAALPADTPLRVVVESSPTTCRILQQISTPPGTLVKNDLLQLAATMGVCFDLMNNPELMLDPKVRAALKSLFHQTATILPRFKSFIEQLALIRNLSFDQVTEMVIPSQSTKDELSSTAGSTTELKVSQTFPKERPEWSFAHLVLAGKRAEQTVTILSSADAPFNVTGSMPEVSLKLSQQQPVSIGISPAPDQWSSVVTFRATMNFDQSLSRLTLRCFKLSDVPDGAFFVVAVPVLPTTDEINIKFSTIEMEMTVGQLLDLELAAGLSSVGQLGMRVETDDGKSFGDIIFTASNPWPSLDIMPIELLSRLAEIDRNMPVPCLYLYDLPNKLSKAEPEDRKAVHDEILACVKSDKPILETLFIKFSKSSGELYREEYLGFISPTRTFPRPLVSDAAQQKQIDDALVNGSDVVSMPVLCKEDVHALAAEMRNWASNEAAPFPFNVANEKFHYCKTRVEFEYSKFTDRFWYLERRIIVHLRPASKVEQYMIEREYWRHMNDNARATLLDELIADVGVQVAQSDAKKLSS